MTAPLTPELLALLEGALTRCPQEVRDAVTAQAARAGVAREVAGRSVDVVVPDDVAAVPAPDGPLRPIPTVVDPEGQPTGEVLVWVRAGRLIGLERPWWTDEAPSRWPVPADLRFA